MKTESKKKKKEPKFISSIHISECGHYIAFHLGHANFDVLQSNGDYWPEPPLSEYPLQKQVGGYSNHSNLRGKKKYRFTLNLLICDPRKKIKPGEGNTIISEKVILFYGKISPKLIPKWAKAMSKLLEETRGLKFVKTEHRIQN